MSIAARASINAGADQSGKITIVDGDVVQPKLADYTGVGTILWEIISFPSGFSTPSGWTAATGRFYWQGSAATGYVPPSIDFTSAPWGLFWFRVTIDNGISGDTVDLDETRDETLAVEILGPSSMRDVPVTDNSLAIPGETFRLVWGAIQANLRLIAPGLLPTGSATGQLASWNNSTSLWQIANNVVTGSGYVGIGSDPAPDGSYTAIGLSNATWIVAKASGGNDAYLLGLDGSDLLTVGEDTDVANAVVRAATSVTLRAASTDRLTISSSGIDAEAQTLSNVGAFTGLDALIGVAVPGTIEGQAARWNNTSSKWEAATGVVIGGSYIALGGNAPSTVGINLSNGESIQGYDAYDTERRIAKIDPTTGNLLLGMADGSKQVDCQGNELINAPRKIYSISTDSDHTLDYANGDYQVLPSGVLSTDRNFTLPSGVADGLAFTFMSLENSHAVYLLGASKPAGGSDPTIVYTTSTMHCMTFRRISGAWQAESDAKWIW